MKTYNNLYKQAEKHGQQVMELAGAYFREQSPEAGRELETLFSATESYADQHCPGYEGILAIHTHVLALHYVNESYNPSLALAYSRMAELNYTAYLRGLNGRERETALLYQYQVWVICAYVAYDGDDFRGALEWLKKLPSSRFGTAELGLAALAQLRMACEQGEEALLRPAFEMLQAMDGLFREPLRYLFEEDIVRAAYSFYEMFFTRGIVHPELPVPYAPDRAASMLIRAKDLLKDSQQREWLQRDIDKLKAMPR